MATTKRANAGRPTIGSSHAGKKSGKPAAKPSRPGRPTSPGRPSGGPRPTGPKSRTSASAGAPKRSARPTGKPAPKKRASSAKPGVRKPAPPPPRRPAPEIRSAPSEASRSAAIDVATAALDKKAVNVQIFDVVGRVDYADFLVLMSGRSSTHVLAIADSIEEAMLKATRRKPTAVEGRQGGNWVVLDFGDLVAHVFQEEARSFYDLDSLWQDARRIPVSAS